ncbi:MAG: asparagine synthase-related protein [Candidatus Omnitrophota bacterium]
MSTLIGDVRNALREAVKKDPAEAILFSGGLDTSILAALDPRIKAISVSLEDFGEDLIFARKTAEHLGLERHHSTVTVAEAIQAVPAVIRILKSFDPAIPNDLVVYAGFKKAKEMGFSSIMTGDASDELFGGYSYMRAMPDLNGYIRRISRAMSFSSNDIGGHFGIRVVQPFCRKEIVSLALGIPQELKINREADEPVGKWILRKAFEDLLPPDVIWQDKRPLECGSGMEELRAIISRKVTDGEFSKRPEHMEFYNKEHFYYYSVFKEGGQAVPALGKGEKACRGCGAGIRPGSFHCKTCGYVPQEGIIV